ncbi:MAG: hypothetical protein PVG11_09695, partial [Anaerolineae bacterium]
MVSTILGWLLVALGVVSYAVALAILLNEQFFKTQEKALLPPGVSEDIKVIGELLDNLAGLLEKFSKLSVPVQWAILGLANIGIGAYLLA